MGVNTDREKQLRRRAKYRENIEVCQEPLGLVDLLQILTSTAVPESRAGDSRRLAVFSDGFKSQARIAGLPLRVGGGSGTVLTVLWS